ncbi:hemolysin secretion protein D [Vibrio cholerae]|uniref:hemolysin secretion protein D n=1 Tax=Vibrio cholerae TaxID=666 RepID=UPI0020C7B6D3|nr:hemolysin secretion protein D [Vibrio cholerae]
MASFCNENTLGGPPAICIVMSDAKAKELHHKVKISNIHLIIGYSALLSPSSLKLQRCWLRSFPSYGDMFYFST